MSAPRNTSFHDYKFHTYQKETWGQFSNIKGKVKTETLDPSRGVVWPAAFEVGGKRMVGAIRLGVIVLRPIRTAPIEGKQKARDRSVAEKQKGQKNTSNCLTLMMACIIHWQAKEMSRVIIIEGEPEAVGVNLSLLEDGSPIGWDSILLYGEYVLKHSLVRA